MEEFSEIKEVSHADNSCKGVLLPTFFNMHSHLGKVLFETLLVVIGHISSILNIQRDIMKVFLKNRKQVVG